MPMLHLTELIYWNSLVEATGSCHCEDEILRKCPDLSIDCKLREFQYKIFYRRFKMVKSPLYPFLQCRGGFPGAPVYWIFGSHWGFFEKKFYLRLQWIPILRQDLLMRLMTHFWKFFWEIWPWRRIFCDSYSLAC